MSECEHDKRFVGVFLLPPEDRGCIACAFERVSAELKDTKEDAAEFYARNKLLRDLVSQAIGWTWAHARANSLQGIELKKNEIPELLQRIQQDIPEMKVAFSDH